MSVSVYEVHAIRRRNGGGHELTDRAVHEVAARFGGDGPAIDGVVRWARICRAGGGIDQHQQVQALVEQARPENRDGARKAMRLVQDHCIAQRARFVTDWSVWPVPMWAVVQDDRNAPPTFTPPRNTLVDYG